MYFGCEVYDQDYVHINRHCDMEAQICILFRIHLFTCILFIWIELSWCNMHT